MQKRYKPIGSCADYFTAEEFFNALDNAVRLALATCKIPYVPDWQINTRKLGIAVTAEEVKKLKLLVSAINWELTATVSTYRYAAIQQRPRKAKAKKKKEI